MDLGDDRMHRGEGAADDAWCQRFFILLTGVFAFRALFILVFPHGLAGDEAYYWDWGRRLDWGYFSKPPLIAWLMALASWLGGASVFGLRVWAALLGTGTLLFTFLAGRLLYNTRTGFWAAVLLAAMPGAVLANLVLTIDAPLLFCWTLALYLFARMWVHGPSLLLGVALCCALGLGYLAKQMMLVFPVLVCLFWVSTRAEKLARKGHWLWLTLAASFVFLVPTIAWNSRHGWITFRHTAHHFDGDWGLVDFIHDFAAFVGSQLGAVSPVAWALMLIVGMRALWSWRQLSPADRYLLLFSVIPLLLALLMTLRQEINPNWPAVFYPAGVIMLSAAFTRAGSTCLPRIRSLRAAIVVAVGFAVLASALPWVARIPALRDRGLDPFIRLQGWQEYAAEIQGRRATLPDTSFLLTVGHRYHTSQLAFNLPDQPVVFRWPDSGEIQSQYEIWGGIEAQAGLDALVIVHDADTLPADLSSRFVAITKLEPVEIRLNGLKTRNYGLYWGKGFQPGGLTAGDAFTVGEAAVRE